MGEYQGSGIPIMLTAEALEPSKSKDVITVEFSDEWSALRTGRASRTIYFYFVRNETKGNQYEVEFFEDDDLAPHGYCECAASVICKHIRAALKDLLVRVPEFGKSVFGGENK